MDHLRLSQAEDDDRTWAATLMAATDPWVSLGRSLEECLRACCRADDQLFIARLGDDRAGFVIVRPSGVAGAPYIPCLAVEAPFRSRGVGAFMIAAVAAMFRARSRYLFLCVSSFNHRARSFYEREGFVEMGTFPDFIIDGASEILMGKRLPAAGPAGIDRAEPTWRFDS